MAETLLVEILTEELPPKALARLGQAFADGIVAGLKSRELLSPEFKDEWFATPRRLAVSIAEVLQQAPDRRQSKKLMPVKVAFKADGSPSEALLRRLEKEGYPAGVVPDSDIQRRMDGDVQYVFLDHGIAGSSLLVGLLAALEESVEALPIPKAMRYQTERGEDVQFARPAHGLVALYGAEVVPVCVLGCEAGRITHGHRFLGAPVVTFGHANEYEAKLREKGAVIADFDKRREEIKRQLIEQATQLCGQFSTERNLSLAEELEGFQGDLLDEVTALVECPTVYVGEFESEFLQVPQECLILTMQRHQKYFPFFNKAGKLLNKFFIVSNMRLDDATNIINGNQRVIRPRLADARFFYEQDKKTKLADRVPQLANIVYHNKLGSQLERTERVRKIARFIAEHIGKDANLADKAAYLAKADLLTGMVGEFPELQGIMGRYYALADGEDPEVAEAIGDQYKIRFDDSAGPQNLTSMALFLADRTELLVGIWGVGLRPTGDKDPFGLRRAALGIISAFELLGGTALIANEPLKLSALDLLQFAETQLAGKNVSTNTASELLEFIYERYRNQLIGLFDRNTVEAVIAVRPPLNEVIKRAEAVRAFQGMPESESLSAANKRAGNMLRQAAQKGIQQGNVVDPSLLDVKSEKDLYAQVVRLTPIVSRHVRVSAYTDALMALAGARDAVDKFFTDVMVMAEDPATRSNRLALLSQLEKLMNQVADISKLAA